MLEVDDLSKTYGETVALDGARITFAPATIHADPRREWFGQEHVGQTSLGRGSAKPGRDPRRRAHDRSPLPAAFQALGVATVFQEVLIAPDRSALDNIFLGCDGLFRRRVPRARQSKLAAEVLSLIANTKFELEAPAALLPLAARQLVVLARALVRRPRVLHPGRSHSGAGLRRS